MNVATSIPNNLRDPAGLMALAAMPGVNAKAAREIASVSGDTALNLPVEMDLDVLALACEAANASIVLHAESGIEIISYFDEAYPPRLREISSPPNLLFCQGEIKLLRAPRSIAVVGTREPSIFGITATATIVHVFAGADFVTVSGLARGIDAVCALTSLDENAPTIAILGGGVDVISPREHAGLAQEIVERGGLLVSEHEMGVPTTGRQLVARNRLQSGIAQALVVGQTPLVSGTMHTVRFAAEQSRRIYCPQPQARHRASEGLYALLETPGEQLPDLVATFASTSAKWRQTHLGSEPLARAITRDNLEAVVLAVEQLPAD